LINTVNRIEKLKSKKLIEQLFAEGQSVSVFPLRLVYLQVHFKEDLIAKTGVSVSKKNFKSAVDRNRIKRLLREVYRLNNADYLNNISKPYAFMILYIGNEKPTFKQLVPKMALLFRAFLNKVSDN